MNKLITALLALAIPVSGFSQDWAEWDNPVKPFDATTKRTFQGKINIDWRLSDNPSSTCDKLSKQFGNAGFAGQELQGCAFWWGETCIIVTAKKPTMHTVGHEVRHCFYGQWHN